MTKYERLGSFALFERIEENKLSKTYLAGQIAENKIKSIHFLKRFDPSLATLPDLILDLKQQSEGLKALANPNIARPTTLLQERTAFGAVFDYLQGKSLRFVLAQCAQDGFPFTPDQALLVTSRLCSALEYLHSKKLDEERLVHGFVSPESIFVSYDGEIKLQFLGLARAMLRFPAGKEKLFHDYANYLAPETLQTGKLDKAADIYSAGLVLFEMLTGEPFLPKGRGTNISDVINQGQMSTNSGERVPISDDIRKALHHALAQDPVQRFAAAADMRKALDQLLFSSESSPTTFNLAFFMHTLFRETIEEENRNIAAYKGTDVASMVAEEPPPPPPKPVAVAAPGVEPRSIPRRPGTPAMPPSPQIFGEAIPKEKSHLPLILGIVLGILVLGTLAVFFYPKLQGQTQPPAQRVSTEVLTPQQKQAQELEKQKLQAEAAAAQEEAKKKDDELKVLQAKLDLILKQQQDEQKKKKNTDVNTTTSTTDEAAIAKLQEQAKKLEEEKKAKEALAEQKLKEAQAQPQPQPPPANPQPPAEVKPASSTGGQPPVSPAQDSPAQAQPSDQQATSNPAVQPETSTPQEASPPAVKEGDLVELTPDVVKPEVLSKVNPTYPAVAFAKKLEGTVILSLLISESGDVTEVKVLRGAGGSSGLNEAAATAVKKWKFRPAVKDGKRVQVWMTYPVVFKLGPQ